MKTTTRKEFDETHRRTLLCALVCALAYIVLFMLTGVVGKCFWGVGVLVCIGYGHYLIKTKEVRWVVLQSTEFYERCLRCGLYETPNE